MNVIILKCVVKSHNHSAKVLLLFMAVAKIAIAFTGCLGREVHLYSSQLHHSDKPRMIHWKKKTGRSEKKGDSMSLRNPHERLSSTPFECNAHMPCSVHIVQHHLHSQYWYNQPFHQPTPVCVH